MLGDDPPYLSVGTEVSAKYKGAFCEAKIRKVVRSVKCRVTYKQGLGTATVTDDQIKGTLRVGASVEAKHNEKKDFVEATVTKIQDCSQYTVVFDDGDITTLRRTALCLKSGRHFAESETLDQLPLTHPEHFGNPVIGGRRGRRSRQAQDESSDDEGSPPRGARESGSGTASKERAETEPEIGRVVCVELGDKKKKDNWFPGLVVAPTAQDTVRIRVRDDYLVRSFKDARYYTVPKKEATEFTKELVNKVENNGLKIAVEKALLFLDKNELPPHWDRDSLFGNADSSGNSDSDGELDSDSSDDEPREEKDHFVAQLYKFMDDRGTPINNCPMIGSQDIDLYRLFRAVYKLGGYNRVTNQNQWKFITRRLGFPIQNSNSSTQNSVKQQYKKFLHSFEDFYRKLGCTMVNHPRGSNRKQRPGRSLIRDRDRNTPVPTQMPLTKIEKEEEEKEKEREKEKEEEKEKVKEKEKRVEEEKKEVKKEPVKEEEILKIKKKEELDESGSGQESDVNIEGEESSCSEKSQKMLPATSTVKVKPPKAKEERKKIFEKKKNESKKVVEKKEEKPKEEEQPTVTRSKSKDDTKVKPAAIETKDARSTPSASENEKKSISSNKQRRPTEEELKKRGRKRKESEPEKPRAIEEASTDPAPSYKGIVELGDRLKVYYGPTHESKVTYEAKVIDMEKEGAEPVYLVHYTGWNTRYDEWIKGSRIAQNFTQTQGRVKRGKTTPRPQTPSTSASKLGKSVAHSRRRAHSVAPTSGNEKTGSAGIGKEAGKREEKDNKEKEPPRSTTPSSIASSSSRTKSPATPANNRQTRVTRNNDNSGLEPRRRTRRMSGHTDISVASETDSDPYESDTTEPEQARTRSRGMEERKRKIKIEDCSEPEEEKDAPEELRRGRRLRRTLGKNQTVKSEPESDDDQPKGRDFDLNQIRSELKGFEKAVKPELVRIERDSDDTNSEDKETTGDKNVSTPVSPKRDKKAAEPTPPKLEPIIEPKTSAEGPEDIYEFKEPEPFEFEVRNKRETSTIVEKDKVKKRVFEEEPKSPKKKQKTVTPAKEIKTETEPDQKKRVRRSFAKRNEDPEVGKPRTQSACEDAFDKLCESPSFSPLKPVPVSEETGKIATSLDLLFKDLPGDEDGPADDPEDRLIISEAEVSEAEQENLFTYQQEIFPASDIPDTMEFSKEEVKDQSVKETEGVKTVQSVIVIEPKQTSSKIPVELKPLDPKPPEISPALSPALVAPAPISTRLPATSTIEEKLSLAFKSKKDGRREEEEQRKAAKEAAKKNEASVIVKKAKEEAAKSVEIEGKKEEDESKKKDEEERREAMRVAIKQKEEELQQLKIKKETELRKAAEAKAAAVAEQKKTTQDKKEEEEEEEEDDEDKKTIDEVAMATTSISRKDEERGGRDQKENKEKDGKRKRVISQEFIDSTDSSDSEQRLVIDNVETPEEKIQATTSSNFDIKLRAELEKLQDIQEGRVQAQVEDRLPKLEAKPVVVPTVIPKTEEEAENINSLLCEEEIPGSPAPAVDAVDPASVSTSTQIPSQVENTEKNIVLLEMPFASAPSSGQTSATVPTTVATGSAAGSTKNADVSLPVSLPVQQGLVLGPRPQPVVLQPVIPQAQAQAVPAPAAPPAAAAGQRRESNEAAPVMDNTPPTTPDSTISNISNSPRCEGEGGSSPLSEDNTKSNRDSSEADNDSASKCLGVGFSEDEGSRDLPNAESTAGPERVSGVKTVPAKRPAEESQSPKKRKRSRKHSECGSNVSNKKSTNVVRHGVRHSMRHSNAGSDSDDTSESSNICAANSSAVNAHANISTVADLAATYSTRSPRPLKYNFYVELDPELDGSQRIAVLQQKLTDLRKTYNAVKVELAGIERRRKKLRRREREALKAAKAECIKILSSQCLF